MRTLYAVDLTTIPAGVSGAPHGLPPGGFASPLGYWFAAEGWGEVPPLRLDVCPPDSGSRPTSAAGPDTDAVGARRRRLPRAVIRPEGAQAGSSPPRGRLDVQVGRGSAQVIAAHADWSDPDTAEAVLLAVAQCWRLQALEHALDELTARARGDLGSGGRRGLAGWWRRRREVLQRDRALRALVLDLPGFEGPLTDPRGYLATARSARLFRALTRRLGLHDWRNLLDERVEAMEAVLAAEVEGLRHAELFTCEIALEALILAALVTDIVFHAAMTLFWGG